MKKLLPISIIILALIIFWIFLRFVAGGPESDEAINCQTYPPEQCPDQCVVCPPCPECSSISCQTENFCQKMGIDREWYKKIQEERTQAEKAMIEESLRVATEEEQKARNKCIRFEQGNNERYLAGDMTMKDEIGENFIEKCIQEILNKTLDWSKYPY